MNPLQFPTHQNFFLKPQSWGEAEHTDIVNLLENVISNFYANLEIDSIDERPVLIAHSSCHNPPRNYPEIITFNGTSFIFLITQNRLWSQYAYQFSHELCHYVINTPFPPIIDRFGWFEESICELASLFTLDRMALTWKTNPPYPNWATYSDCLKLYVENIEKEESSIVKSFSQWLSENIETLYNDRINRQFNRKVALQLLPVFKKYPNIWKVIHYLKSIVVTSEMDFNDYLSEWEKHLPNNLAKEFVYIETALLNKAYN